MLYRTVKKHKTQSKRRWVWLDDNRCPVLFVLVCFIWIFPFSQPVHGEQSRAGEYDLKAVYLYNFLHFVHWPEDKNNSDDFEPKVIAIVGSSPLGNSLKKLQDKLQNTGKKNILISYLGPYREGMDLSSCHLLFVSASEKKNFAKIIADLKGSSILTVADTDGFLTAGGMIALVTRKNRIRWEINRTPVHLAGLRLSAKLLDIAFKVVDIPEQAVSEWSEEMQ